MRAAVFNGPGRSVTIENLPDPKPGREELLVKIGRCGICGSDLSFTSEGPFAYPAGMRLGHEYAGEVMECGRDVTGVKVGDRVACFPSVGCGNCRECREGRILMCASSRPVFGGFGEYVAVPYRNAAVLPQSLSLADGALVEPMACGLHALRMAGMRGGECVIVIGAGSMALAVVYWARILRAGRIIVISRSTHRHDAALAMGADAVYGMDDGLSEDLIQKENIQPDIVAECVGKEGMLKKAVDYIRSGGVVISMGMCPHSESIIPAYCSFKEVKILFPLAYTMSEFIETLKAFEFDRVSPALMVSNIIPLEDFPETLETMRHGWKGLKAQVDPNLGTSRVR